MLFSEFCHKEVISVKDCRKLGHVKDMEFDECSGCICKIIVRNGFCLCNIFQDADELIIPMKKICQIGPDIILVDL